MATANEARVTNGTPTAPAVRKILEAHGDLKPGDIIEYATLEECVMEGRDSNRWRTVVNRWRQHLLSENIVLEPVRNVGYEVLDPSRRIQHAARQEDGGRKKIGRALHVANGTETDELSREERGYIDHLNRTYSSILLYERVKPKAIAPPK